MRNYLILNEIISSTIVYDQDANRSRRFTLAALGASLNFIAICFIQCFLFVDIWTFTWICYRISNKQKVDIEFQKLICGVAFQQDYNQNFGVQSTTVSDGTFRSITELGFSPI